MTRHQMPGRRARLGLRLAAIALLAAAAAQAQTVIPNSVNVPSQVCRGQQVTFQWQTSSQTSGLSFQGIYLFRSATGQLISPTQLGINPTSYQWTVPSSQTTGAHYVQVRYGQVPPIDQGVALQSGQFQINDCSSSGGSDPGAQLRREVEDLERMLWQEQYSGRGSSPFPSCLSCPYQADLSGLFRALDQAKWKGEVKVSVTDGRSALATLGTFRPSSRGFSGLSPRAAIKASRALEPGRNCGLQLHVADRSGRSLARAPLCVEVGK